MTRPALTITISPDAATVTLAKSTWSQTIPAEDLPGRITLYQRLRDRDGGKHREFYEADVAALEAAQRDIKRRKMT
jgi:hypothetical protein